MISRPPAPAPVIVGESQPPEVHAVAHAINAQLKSSAALTSDPVEADPDVVGMDSMRALSARCTQATST